MLGGPGIPLDENMIKSDSLNNTWSGKSRTEIVAGQDLLKRMIREAKRDQPTAVKEANLIKIIDIWRGGLPPEVGRGVETFTRNKPDHWHQMASEWSTPYFTYVLNYDPYPVLSKISCPVLSLIGEKDVQTPPRENSERIKAALENGICDEYRVEIVEDLNHLFLKCETGTIGEYTQLKGKFDLEVMRKISAWIRKQTGQEN
jgi:pimeloyl-ACP methyl ester carboxylesterase